MTSVRSSPHGPATNTSHVLVDQLPRTFGVYRYSIFDIHIYIAPQKVQSALVPCLHCNGPSSGFENLYQTSSRRRQDCKHWTHSNGEASLRAMFTNIGTKFEICVLDPDRPNVQPLLTGEMDATRRFSYSSTNIYFDFTTPGSNQKEVFEWRKSRGPEVQNLKGWSSGLKFVRVKTGELTAAWAGPTTMLLTRKLYRQATVSG